MSEQLDLFAPVVGPSSSLNGWLAALDNAARNPGQRFRLLEAYDRHRDGMTDERAQVVADLGSNAIRPRRQELAQLGLIEKAGKAQTRAGNQADVWRITVEGVNAVIRRHALAVAS